MIYNSGPYKGDLWLNSGSQTHPGSMPLPCGLEAEHMTHPVDSEVQVFLKRNRAKNNAQVKQVRQLSQINYPYF